MSSGLNKAMDIISSRFPPDMWNVYTIYGSDGDNWGEDNEKTIKAVKALNSICNLVAYIELLPSLYGGSMYGRMIKDIKDKNFAPVVVREKKELWNALKVILGKELKEGV